MFVQVMIDTSSKEDAELVAASLPGEPTALSVRGYGLIKLRWRRRELQDLIERVGAAAEQHGLGWVRVRHGDEEYAFRNGVPRYR